MVVGRVHVGDDDLAELAARARDEHDTMAGGDGLGHGPTGADRLVVGVGVDGHQGRAMARGVGRHGVLMLAHLPRPGDGSAVGVGRRPAGRAASGAATIGRDGQPTRPGSARRPARRRLLDRPGRAVLHDAAGRPRRRRRQGRAARGRRDARLGTAVGRAGRGRGRAPDRGLLPGGQSEQARHPARPQAARRRRRPAPVARARRRPGRELPGRRVRAARPRRRGAATAEPGARPPGHLGLRAGRPRRGTARL